MHKAPCGRDIVRRWVAFAVAEGRMRFELAGVERAASKLNSERSRDRSLRMAGVGARMLPRVATPCLKRFAAAAETDLRGDREAHCRQPCRQEIRRIVNPGGASPEIEI